MFLVALLMFLWLASSSPLLEVPAGRDMKEELLRTNSQDDWVEDGKRGPTRAPESPSSSTSADEARPEPDSGV